MSVYPPGYRPGCLPRKSRFGEICSLAKEKIPIIPEGEWDQWIGKVTLRPLVWVVLNQLNVGSCASESSTQSLMLGREIAGQPEVLLNPYYVYHTVSHGRDSGSSIDENLDFLRSNGCASEEIWPRSKGWKGTPSAEANEDAKKYKIVEFYDIGTTQECVSALLCGFPVVYGADGHAVCAIAHLNAKEPQIVNSWGESWKDGGFGVWVGYNQIGWGYGMYAVRTTGMSDSPTPPEPVA